jgi:hypothetical protein
MMNAKSGKTETERETAPPLSVSVSLLYQFSAWIPGLAFLAWNDGCVVFAIGNSFFIPLTLALSHPGHHH